MAMTTPMQRPVVLFSILIAALSIRTACAEDNPTALVDTTRARELVWELMAEADRRCSTFAYYELDTAITLLDSALEMKRALAQTTDTTYAALNWHKGFAYGLQGVYDSCEHYAREAMIAWDSCFGPGHPMQGRGLFLVAYAKMIDQKPIEATDLLEHGLDLCARHPDCDPVWKGVLLYYLGVNRCDQGLYDEAEALVKESVAMIELARGPAHYLIGMGYGTLGTIYARASSTWPDTPESEAAISKAIEVLEASLGPHHPITAGTYLKLASGLMVKEKYGEAEPLIRKVLEIHRNTRPPWHQDIKWDYQCLARLADATGRWEDAIGHWEKTIELHEFSPGSSYSNVTQFHMELARSCYQAGYKERAYELFKGNVDTRKAFIETIFPAVPENLKLAYARLNPPQDNAHLTMALRENAGEVTRSAFGSVIVGKGLVIDALMGERKIGYCADDPLLDTMFDKHADICEEIAELTVSGITQIIPDPGSVDVLRLYEVKDSLEAVISSRCHDYAVTLNLRESSIEQIAGALPDNSALCDYVLYRPYNYGALGRRNQWGPRKYLAFVLTDSNRLDIVDLGPAAPIDSLILACHNHISEARELIQLNGEEAATAEFKTIAGLLYARLLDPLLHNLGERRRLFICPDSRLHLMPFELLVSPGGRFATEDYHISYLASGRDIIKFTEPPVSVRNQAVIVAAPDHEAKPRASSPAILAALTSDGQAAHTRGPSDRSECLTVPFDPLPSTLEEGTAVADILSGQSDMLLLVHTGARASEAILKSLDFPPRVLHLATHGFFCPKSRLATADLKENPLLYSGIVLAGANLTIVGASDSDPDDFAEDGLLTALEASSLNLMGTELVVLSSCRSGVGETRYAEGVFGLRRAIHHAGARSVIMSLFDVDDESTAVQMQRFYEHWLSGESKSSALRETSLSTIGERRRSNGVAHPVFWGGFILAGDPY